MAHQIMSSHNEGKIMVWMPPASQVFTIDGREEDLQKQNVCKASSQLQHPGQEKLRCSLGEKAFRSSMVSSFQKWYIWMCKNYSGTFLLGPTSNRILVSWSTYKCNEQSVVFLLGLLFHLSVALNIKRWKMMQPVLISPLQNTIIPQNIKANLRQPGSWRNWVWSASPLLPPVPCHPYWIYVYIKSQ